jgi:very-short-patch-repair endonuclease
MVIGLTACLFAAQARGVHDLARGLDLFAHKGGEFFGRSANRIGTEHADFFDPPLTCVGPSNETIVEQIVTQLLRELLASTRFAGLRFHCQVRLQQLASARNPAMTPRELEFMAQQASCDFVVYFKVGKQPLGVIEVDGGLHHGPQQGERDALKNSILRKSGIDLLRLQTIDSDIEARLDRFLAQWVDTDGAAAEAVARDTTPPPAVPAALH